MHKLVCREDRYLMPPQAVKIVLSVYFIQIQNNSSLILRLKLSTGLIIVLLVSQQTA